MCTVAAFYQFARFDDPASLKAPLFQVADAHGIKGTLLLAREGINGTIAGCRDGIDAVIAHIRTLPGCADLEWKESAASEMPFARLKVRLKREIVSMGQPDMHPAAPTGAYIEPADWNALIRDPDVAVIDTRNDYEVAIGSFDGAIDPETRSFRDFPDWWARNHNRFEGRKVAMFCTGGIRCEKATNYVLSHGAKEVFHLKGGILKYLEDVPEEDGLWQGECFVFDQRVSVVHGLKEGQSGLCHACRRPVPVSEAMHPDYEPGVSCSRCIREFSEEDRTRFRERQKQIRLARSRGTSHLGQG